MSGPEENLFASRDRRARRDVALRVKQFTSILTTVGYALLAGGAWQPLLEAKPFGLVQAIAGGFGVAALMLSIYLVPRGEPRDD